MSVRAAILGFLLARISARIWYLLAVGEARIVPFSLATDEARRTTQRECAGRRRASWRQPDAARRSRIRYEGDGMAQTNGPSKTLPPVTLADLMQALNATEANIHWWEGDGTLPKAERDQDGRLLWDVRALQELAKSEAGQKFLARRA
jgi:hypothetical protein